MTKRPDYEQKMEGVNWELKNRGYEIVGLHGARSSGFYNSQASRGLKHIEEKFDHIIELLDSWKANEKGIVSMRITGIGIVFDFKRYTPEEKKARSIMNKMGLGERKPEYKGRAASIFCDWDDFYKSDDDFVHGWHAMKDTGNHRVVANVKDTDRLFEARQDGDRKMMRLGRRLQFDKKERVWTCEWQEWMTGKEADSINFDKCRAAEAKVKKIFRKYIEA